MQLHSFFNSSTSYRVRIALALKGLPVDITPVNLRKQEQRAADYVARNPSAGVPLLTDGDFQLSQSLAIIDYLDATHPEPRLIPAAPRDVAADDRDDGEHQPPGDVVEKHGVGDQHAVARARVLDRVAELRSPVDFEVAALLPGVDGDALASNDLPEPVLAVKQIDNFVLRVAVLTRLTPPARRGSPALGGLHCLAV